MPLATIQGAVGAVADIATDPIVAVAAGQGFRRAVEAGQQVVACCAQSAAYKRECSFGDADLFDREFAQVLVDHGEAAAAGERGDNGVIRLSFDMGQGLSRHLDCVEAVSVNDSGCGSAGRHCIAVITRSTQQSVRAIGF